MSKKKLSEAAKIIFDSKWYLNVNPDVAQSSLQPWEHFIRFGFNEGRDPCPLFNSKWYLGKYPDVAASGMVPLSHYVNFGWKEGRRPSELFDGAWYLAVNEDVRMAEVNPLEHFISSGWREGRRPNPLFDTAWYLMENEDVAAAGTNPLSHFISSGWSTGRNPHPLFDVAWYLELHADVKASGLNPLGHYLVSGWSEGRSTHPLFDGGWYLATYADVFASGMDPIQHYESSGGREGRQPHPLFDGAWYLAVNEDVASAELNPLLHYLSSGWIESRKPHPLFDPLWYCGTGAEPLDYTHNPYIDFLKQGWKNGRNPNPIFELEFYLRENADVSSAGLNPFEHYVRIGWKEGRKPHPLFDGSWYLSKNPDVAAALINPLQHYLSSGASEGRDPHPLFDAGWYLQTNPDVSKAAINPLLHYLVRGASEGRSPHALFEEAWYRSTYLSFTRDVCVGLLHYLSAEGRVQQTNPNRYFDVGWYKSMYLPTHDLALDPLRHYIEFGAKNGFDPSVRFNTNWYLNSNEDVRRANLNPLAHFLSMGEAEGREPLNSLPQSSNFEVTTPSYEIWLKAHLPSSARDHLDRRYASNFEYKPQISLIVPVYKVAPDVLNELIVSIFKQSYANWQLCIALSFRSEQLISLVERAAQADARVKYTIIENGGISKNSMSALGLATGDFIGLLDHDDTLATNALFTVAAKINETNADFVYSDKDNLSESGQEHFAPLFKGSWSPETMLSANYLTHFNVIRRSFVEIVGGWDASVDGAQDWDLFFRIIASGAHVEHVPQILYHWRHVATSVAAGGLAAKPYAAQAQLESITRWLHKNSWQNALPHFNDSGYTRISWNYEYRDKILLLVVGDARDLKLWEDYVRTTERDNRIEIAIVRGRSLDAINTAIFGTEASISVIVPGALSPRNSDWLKELTAPFQNGDIAVVGGKVLDQSGKIYDAGWVQVDGAWKPLFRGSEENTYSVFGSSNWYRNFSGMSCNGIAIRTDLYRKSGGLRPIANCGQELCRSILDPDKARIMYNPFALSTLDPEQSLDFLFWDVAAVDIPSAASKADPYFSPHLVLDRIGMPILRETRHSSSPKSHDYEAEAGYFGGAVDYSDDEVLPISLPEAQIKTNVKRKIAWVVPDFSMPFYGGIMTFLRSADYLYRKHKIVPVFLGVGTQSAESLRSAIGAAFPALAKESEIHCLDGSALLRSIDVGPLLAAVATLWTTAYVVRRMSNVGKKFYFVQDYEPLFYPAGTTSSFAEATYRFGFVGICNTEPLKSLYTSFGGTAEFFNPSVDASVFNTEGRIEKDEDAPVTIFSYARPGHPRNCFEVLSLALKALKAKYGARIQIYTAGSDWDPHLYGLEDTVEHLGLLSYRETGHLYRSCDIGIVAMATCHPSYLPFELMSSGAVVATNFNRYTGWLLNHGENCYQFELSRSSIEKSLSTIIESRELRHQIRTAAITTISSGYRDWDSSCETVAQIFDKYIPGGLYAHYVGEIEGADS